jgi:hypothetical protein
MIYFAAFENKDLSEHATIDLFVVAGVVVRPENSAFPTAAFDFNNPLGYATDLDRRLKE